MHNADVCIPELPEPCLPVFKVPPSVQDEPSYSSARLTRGDGGCPPKTSPAVNVPAPPIILLAVPRFPPAVQSVPSYSSVAAANPPAPGSPHAPTAAY